MTYQWNIVCLLEQDAVDERAEDLVEAPEIEPDDRARDDHDDDALERLPAARPVDLPQLGVRLADELPARLRLLATGLLLDGLLGRADLRLAAPTTPARSLSRGSPGGAPLTSRLAGHLAGLPVRGVAAAPAAVLGQLETVRRVPLGLLCLVIAPLALRASERDRDSYSGCHSLCLVR